MKAKQLKVGDRFTTRQNDCTLEVLSIEPFKGNRKDCYCANWIFRTRVIESQVKRLKVGEKVAAALGPNDEVELVRFSPQQGKV